MKRTFPGLPGSMRSSEISETSLAPLDQSHSGEYPMMGTAPFRTRAYALVVLLASATTAQAQAPKPDYHRADLMRTAARYVFGTSAAPRLLEDSARFYYTSSGRNDRGITYLVDPRAASKRQLFDNTKLAAALSIAA